MPLVLFGDPGESTFSVLGTGTKFDTDPSHMANGEPADQTAIKWTTASDQDTDTFIRVQRLWETEQNVRTIVLRGWLLPRGTRVVLTGKREGDDDFTYALGGNSSSRFFLFPDGSFGLIVVCDVDNDPLLGVQVKIYNDVNGAATLTPGQWIYGGCFMCFQGYEPPEGVEYDWAPKYDGVPAEDRSDWNQPKMLPTRPYDVIEVTLTTVDYDQAFGNAADPDAITYNSLSEELVMGGPCGTIIRYLDAEGDIDEWSIHVNSVFGVARNVGKPRHMGSNYFQLTTSFAEAPPNN